MHQKGALNIFALFLVLVIVAGGIYVAYQRNTPTKKLLRACPAEWYINQMPGPRSASDLPREYFIYGGERRELSEFDVEWVRANCEVKVNVVE